MLMHFIRKIIFCIILIGYIMVTGIAIKANFFPNEEKISCGNTPCVPNLYDSRIVNCCELKAYANEKDFCIPQKETDALAPDAEKIEITQKILAILYNDGIEKSRTLITNSTILTDCFELFDNWPVFSHLKGIERLRIKLEKEISTKSISTDCCRVPDYYKKTYLAVLDLYDLYFDIFFDMIQVGTRYRNSTDFMTHYLPIRRNYQEHWIKVSEIKKMLNKIIKKNK